MVVGLYALWQLAGNLATGGFHAGDHARRVDLGHRADAAAAQRARRPGAAAPAPAAFRAREPLLRDHALRDADRDADLAVRPAPRRLPGGAQRDGREHGDLPADLLHPRRAAAAAARRRASWTWRPGTASPSTARSARPRAPTSCPPCRRSMSPGRSWSPGPSSPGRRSRWRWLIVLHPAVTVFVVVATGNHYWADGIVAAVIDAAVIWAHVAAGTRRLRPAPRSAAGGRTRARARQRPGTGPAVITVMPTRLGHPDESADPG